MCVQYIGGCSVHRGVPWVHRGVPWVHRGVPWVHRGVPWVHLGDTMSTSGGYHEYIGGIPWVHRGISWVHRGVFSTSEGYHEYIRGISWVHQGISWVHRGDIMSTSGDVQYIGVFNRNWKDFIKLLPHICHDIPPMYWTSPDVLMISPDVLMISPDVLNTPRCTEIPRCTEHTLYRVVPLHFYASWMNNTNFSAASWVFEHMPRSFLLAKQTKYVSVDNHDK